MSVLSPKLHRKRISAGLFVLLLTLHFSISVPGQTPPLNDDLTNAIALTGTDTTFTGTLANATLEPNEQMTAFGTNYFYINKSIWWRWQAPVSTVLNLQIAVILPYADYIPVYGYPESLLIYSASNDATGLDGMQLPALASSGCLIPPHSTTSIHVDAGTTYFFQLVGASTNNYQFHLIATNTPLIFRAPVSQTVSSNASTIFYVDSGGPAPRTFQWYFNGTSIAGQTAPILALNNIDSGMAGTYSVLVSNAYSSIMSAPATLAVSQSNISPTLGSASRHSDVLTFNLTGESGRAYRIQTSPNLVNWTDVNIFPFSPTIMDRQFPWLTSMVHPGNLPLQLAVTNKSPQAFYHASIYKAGNAQGEICINNLRQIVVAKELWRTETKASATAYPSFPDVAGYLPTTNIYCPDDPEHLFSYSYAINNLDSAPICVIDTIHHILEELP